MATMKAAFVSQGKEGSVKAGRSKTGSRPPVGRTMEYHLLPKLRSLTIPTLVVSGDHDFIPGEIAEPIANAIPNARLVTLKNRGHFSCVECPMDVRSALDEFLRRTAPRVNVPDELGCKARSTCL